MRKGCRALHATELTASITALANGIASGREIDEIALLASVFVQLGDTLATIAAHRSVSDAK